MISFNFLKKLILSGFITSPQSSYFKMFEFDTYIKRPCDISDSVLKMTELLNLWFFVSFLYMLRKSITKIVFYIKNKKGHLYDVLKNTLSRT